MSLETAGSATHTGFLIANLSDLFALLSSVGRNLSKLSACAIEEGFYPKGINTHGAYIPSLGMTAGGFPASSILRPSVFFFG